MEGGPASSVLRSSRCRWHFVLCLRVGSDSKSESQNRQYFISVLGTVKYIGVGTWVAVVSSIYDV